MHATRPDRLANRFRPIRSALLFFLISAAGSGFAQTATNGFGFDDFLLVPVRVHLLTAADGSPLNTSFAESDFTRILPKMNRVWSQAGVHFYLESLVREPAKPGAIPDDITIRKENEWLLDHVPPATHASNAFNIYYIKRFAANGVYFKRAIFVKDIASLKAVDGGIDEPLPRVTSHELGHALSLPHRQDVTNLMASGTTGTWLNAQEIKLARGAAKKFAWIKSAPEVLKEADRLDQEHKATAARPLYQHLATIPLAVDKN
jgi:hypothetical protein